MIRNRLVIAAAVVALLGLSTGSAYAAGRTVGERRGTERARQETIAELQGQFQEALARLQASGGSSGTSAQAGGGQGSASAPAASATPSPGRGDLPGGSAGGGFFGGAAGGGAQRGLAGAGLTGRVEKIEGERLTLTLAQGLTVTAVLSQDTIYYRTVSGAKAEIQQGSRVTIEGQRQPDGTIQTTQVTLVSAGS